ncbi:MAG: hypothetical protein WCD89_16430 [Anaerocolumna sp.]
MKLTKFKLGNSIFSRLVVTFLIIMVPIYMLAIRWKIMTQYDMNENMRQLQQRLLTIKNSSSYIKEVSVHVYPIGRTISSNAGVGALDNEKYQGIRVPSDVKGSQIISFHGGLFLSTFQEKSFSDDSPNYIINMHYFLKVL